MIIKLLQNIWNISVIMAPSLFIGLILVGVLHVLMPKDYIKKHLKNGNYKDIIKVILLGVPLPLCSCGVIPAAVSLDKEGASKGATTAFLISTPQTGIDSITVTATLLGGPLAIFKIFVAAISGFIAGILVDSKKINIKKKQNKVDDKIKIDKSKKKFGKITAEIFSYAYFKIFSSIDKWLLIGIIISALITLFFEPHSLQSNPLVSGSSGLFVMLLISLPLYVCTTGSVPIAAALVASGMPLGSSLIFLIAGPATNIATLGALNKILGKKNILIYLLIIIVFSLASSFIFNNIMPSYQISGENISLCHQQQSLISKISGMLLIILLIYSISQKLFLKIRSKIFNKQNYKEKINFTIKGLSCPQCVMKLERKMLNINGIKNVRVNVKNGEIIIFGSNLNRQQTKKVLEDMEYEVED